LWHYSIAKNKTTNAQPNAAQGSYLGFAPVVYNTAETNDSPEIKKEVVRLRGLDYVALPHTETEVQEVSRILAQKGYKSDVYLRKNATVEQFKNTLQQYPNLQFLHIAAHGVFNANNPQLSGIVFSPNTNEDALAQTTEQPIAATKRDIAEQYGTMLYMGDTYQLNLKNVQLVVLSCCDTGLGKMASGEGMMAINRGFLYAGAQNVVFTLFKIPDQQSNLLVQALFKYLLSGQTYATALKNAKQEILTQTNIRPIHWAGFVLLGNNCQ
jgi:CHAT domain-containing protein